MTTRYINTHSSNTAGGDGTTNAIAGANRAYASMSEWEAAEGADLVTATDGHIVYCSSGDGTKDTTTVVINGFTTDATYYVQIIGNDTDGFGKNPDGIFNTTYYTLSQAIASSAENLDVRDNYTRVTDIQLEDTGTVAGAGVVLGVNAAVVVLNSLIISVAADATHTTIGIKSLTSTNGRVINCIVFNSDTVGNGDGIDSGGGTGWVLYNNTVEGFDNGIKHVNGSGESWQCYNTLVFNCTDDFNVSNAGGTVTIDYCASDDADGTNAVDFSPGGTEATDWATYLNDYTNNDYQPADNSSVIYQAGDPTNYYSASDVIDTTRDTVNPSIGAFEEFPISYIDFTAGNTDIAITSTGAIIAMPQLSGGTASLAITGTAALQTLVDLLASRADITITVADASAVEIAEGWAEKLEKTGGWGEVETASDGWTEQTESTDTWNEIV